MDLVLFSDESIDLDNGDLIEVDMSDDDINKKYREGEIRIVTEQARYPLSSIAEMVSNDDYLLNPEYQRRHRWSNAKRSALIESLIMNVPLPPIFLYEYEYSRYEVMDGLQRLTTISSFYNDEFELVDLKKWPELNGKKRSTLPSLIKRGIDRRYISAIILLNESAKTPDEAEIMKQMVFERINSGGEDLSPQESRNANFDGKFNKRCIDLSSNIDMCNTHGIPIPTDGEDLVYSERAKHPYFKKMYDVELVLRFFAYRQQIKLKKSLSLEGYLDKYLDLANKFPDSVMDQLTQLFEDTISLAFELFDESAFYLYRDRKGHWTWYERPTVAVYLPLMSALSKNIQHRETLIARKSDISTAREAFYQANYGDFGGRNVNDSMWLKREALLDGFIEGFI